VRSLHVAATWWPAVRYGGPIVSIRGLCRALARAGDAVQVLTTTVDGPTDSAVPTDVDVDDGGPRLRYHRSPWLRRVYWSPALQRSLAETAPMVDLVHAHGVFLWPTLAAGRAARRASRPFVLSPRGMLVRALIDARSRLAKRAWLALLERANLRGAAAIHATSAHERDALHELGLGPLRRIEVIPNGVDLPAAVAEPPDRRRLLFVGRLSGEKRLDLLLDSLVGVDGATLDIVGPDPAGLRPSLERRAAGLGLADRVAFRGPLDAAGVRGAIDGCDALVLTSRSENFGNVVLEAMAAARPVVVTPGVGAAAEVRAARGGLVAADDPRGLAAALSQVLDAPALARTMGLAGRFHVARNLSWDAVAMRMRALYADLVGDPR
jgi:glycosyltransferase involved in cell wall biosynthesis